MRFRFRNVHTNLYLGYNHRDNKKPYTTVNPPGWGEAWGIVELNASHLPGDAVADNLINVFLVMGALSGLGSVILAPFAVTGLAAVIVTAAGGAAAMGAGVAGFLMFQNNAILGNVSEALFTSGEQFVIGSGGPTHDY